MPRKLNYYILVIVGMGFSLLISSYLLQSLFIDKNPTPFWDSLSQKVLLTQSSVLNYIEQMQLKSSIDSVEPSPTPSLTPDLEPSIAAELPSPSTPTSTPYIPLPTPSSIPTLILLPTIIIKEPTPIRPTIKPVVIPTSIPTLRPTIAPSPTKTVKPPVDVGFAKVVGDPLKQTWYGNGSLACYTTERFIQVYANGLTPNACFANVKAYVDSNIVSTTLLGKSIQVHKKALPAFQAVSKTLDQYKVDSTTYKFPSKTYKIKNVGAYIFRCNVNASTSGKADVCNPGCKLSPHAFGIGVDINYDENCNGCKNYDMPKEISDTFEIYGFRWGGHYPLLGSYIDPMHFEYMRDLCEGI